jgi:hypothetical protein
MQVRESILNRMWDSTFGFRKTFVSTINTVPVGAIFFAMFVFLAGTMAMFLLVVQSNHQTTLSDIYDELRVTSSEVVQLRKELEKYEESQPVSPSSVALSQPSASHQELRLGPVNIFIGVTIIDSHSEDLVFSDTENDEEMTIVLTETEEPTPKATNSPTVTPTLTPSATATEENKLMGQMMDKYCPKSVPEDSHQPKPIPGYTWHVFQCWAVAQSGTKVIFSRYDYEFLRWKIGDSFTMNAAHKPEGIMLYAGTGEPNNPLHKALVTFIFTNISGGIYVIPLQLKYFTIVHSGAAYLDGFEYKSGDKRQSAYHHDDGLTISRESVKYYFNPIRFKWEIK